MAELSICVRCSVVQAGTWGLPSVEPELLLQLLQSACERTMLKLPVPANPERSAYAPGTKQLAHGINMLLLFPRFTGAPPRRAGQP